MVFGPVLCWELLLSKHISMHRLEENVRKNISAAMAGCAIVGSTGKIEWKSPFMSIHS